MRIRQIILLVITLILCVLRIQGVTSQSYQAIAHVFVGGLIVAACIKRIKVEEDHARVYYMAMAVVLICVEVSAAVWTHVLN
jgi:uncharacterized membrane protein